MFRESCIVSLKHRPDITTTIDWVFRSINYLFTLSLIHKDKLTHNLKVSRKLATTTKTKLTFNRFTDTKAVLC